MFKINFLLFIYVYMYVPIPFPAHQNVGASVGTFLKRAQVNLQLFPGPSKLRFEAVSQGTCESHLWLERLTSKPQKITFLPLPSLELQILQHSQLHYVGSGYQIHIFPLVFQACY